MPGEKIPWGRSGRRRGSSGTTWRIVIPLLTANAIPLADTDAQDTRPPAAVPSVTLGFGGYHGDGGGGGGGYPTVLRMGVGLVRALIPAVEVHGSVGAVFSVHGGGPGDDTVCRELPDGTCHPATVSPARVLLAEVGGVVRPSRNFPVGISFGGGGSLPGAWRLASVTEEGLRGHWTIGVELRGDSSRRGWRAVLAQSGYDVSGSDDNSPDPVPVAGSATRETPGSPRNRAFGLWAIGRLGPIP